MDLGLRGRSAFVAGSSSGLGLAAATALVREGCNVTICSRDQSRIDDAARAILHDARVPSSRVLPLTCDVTDEAQVCAALDAAVEHYNGLHILITNAGGPPTGLIDDFDIQGWRDGLELNLMSTINLCRHALPYLRNAARQDRHARILMITSIAAKQPIGTLYLSNTSRAGVQGFAKTLSEEVGPEGITVNTLMPGFTRTDRLTHLVEDIMARTGKLADEVEADWAAGAALRRLGEPEEFGAVTAFLTSKQAAFITGIALPIDGGYSKHVL